VSRLRIFGVPEISADSANGLQRLNELPRAQALKAFQDCCGSRKWAAAMVEYRPFRTESELFDAADKVWNDLKPAAWLAAFRHHPPIGGKKAKSKQSSKASGWSAKEQAAAQAASSETLAALAHENRLYSRKFGYVFLICATGKSSDEVLAALRQRLPNARELEMKTAAEEQRKITRLRLEKLLAS